MVGGIFVWNFLFSSGGVRRKIVVDAALSHQIFVRAFLGYVAVFEDKNSVGIAHSRQAVCNGYRRAVLRKFLHSALNLAFGFIVESRSCFVEN